MVYQASRQRERHDAPPSPSIAPLPDRLQADWRATAAAGGTTLENRRIEMTHRLSPRPKRELIYTGVLTIGYLSALTIQFLGWKPLAVVNATAAQIASQRMLNECAAFADTPDLPLDAWDLCQNALAAASAFHEEFAGALTDGFGSVVLTLVGAVHLAFVGLLAAVSNPALRLGVGLGLGAILSASLLSIGGELFNSHQVTTSTFVLSSLLLSLPLTLALLPSALEADAFEGLAAVVVVAFLLFIAYAIGGSSQQLPLLWTSVSLYSSIALLSLGVVVCRFGAPTPEGFTNSSPPAPHG